MVEGYSLWKVTFSYETPGEEAYNRSRDLYTVVARDKDEAETKAYTHFSDTRHYDDLSLHVEGRVRISVNKIKKRKLTLPELTLEEDQQQFSILPRFSIDHSSIEYLVTEIKGK